jgi:hypothetical protein
MPPSFSAAIDANYPVSPLCFFADSGRGLAAKIVMKRNV